MTRANCPRGLPGSTGRSPNGTGPRVYRQHRRKNVPLAPWHSAGENPRPSSRKTTGGERRTAAASPSCHLPAPEEKSQADKLDHLKGIDEGQINNRGRIAGQGQTEQIPDEQPDPWHKQPIPIVLDIFACRPAQPRAQAVSQETAAAGSNPQQIACQVTPGPIPCPASQAVSWLSRNRTSHRVTGCQSPASRRGHRSSTR